MAHQSRVSPDNQLMDLHIREVKWPLYGWHVVSPKRFTETEQKVINRSDLVKSWEVIRIQDAKTDRKLEYGQILYGQNKLSSWEAYLPRHIKLLPDGSFNADLTGKWEFSG